jgi:hypothetical protein
MCCEQMRLETRERREYVPGTGEVHVRVAREWVCPECDYFEEVLDD